ncbi:uncharacterized protein LOC102806794 [Saccoglossus kowalevskii]|uniref:Uncharacterized protein LOC102806794 isoform X1 n=1 Tax=Saccoglossus kowalevskii TaxID=10224 RepID=A0ABM0LTW0_SACKO|nr:PREDICTED: uncharacterized protein LOC102806794 isoform X1 [Saccoglossus kowalevskii]XP_006811199.1 PREDICTED: uncharacterized protein LOC102806794 isoform X2 [Saccoglossus kowalevskii]XP_006811200.1 PREDICTED: uncharacterized protein LOC102806794 isoform X3 [Saccoglossus kowalevskii]XP_006811201.1 PREDICTED: uncharacterized protein LOC102806794 isoform X4 [Saccoglossus kowalevskii]
MPTYDIENSYDASSTVEILELSKAGEKRQQQVENDPGFYQEYDANSTKLPVWTQVIRFLATIVIVCFSLSANWVNSNLQWQHFPWERYYAAAADNATTEYDGVAPVTYSEDSERTTGIGWLTNYDISTIMALQGFCIILTILYAVELCVMYTNYHSAMPQDSDATAACVLRCHFIQILTTLLMGDLAISLINYRLTGVGPNGSCRLALFQYPNELNIAQTVAMAATFLILAKKLIYFLCIILVPVLGRTRCFRCTQRIPGNLYFSSRKHATYIQRYRLCYAVIALCAAVASIYFCVGTLVNIVGRTDQADVRILTSVHKYGHVNDIASRRSLPVATLENAIQAGPGGYEVNMRCNELWNENSGLSEPRVECSPPDCSVRIQLFYSPRNNSFWHQFVDGGGSTQSWTCSTTVSTTDGDHDQYYYTSDDVWVSYYDTCYRVCDAVYTTRNKTTNLNESCF